MSVINTQNKTFKLKFDANYNGRLFAVQGDTGRNIIVQIVDDLDEIVDIEHLNLILYIGDEKEVTYVEGAKVNGRFNITLQNTQLKNYGVHKAQFVLQDESGLKIGSKLFDIDIEESIENGATVGKNVLVDFAKVDEAIEMLKGYDKTLEEARIVDEALKEKVESLNTITDDLESKTDQASIISKGLDDKISSANQTMQSISVNTNEANNAKLQLDASISEGNITRVNLENQITTNKTEIDEILKSNKSEIASQVEESKKNITNHAEEAISKTRTYVDETIPLVESTISDAAQAKEKIAESIQTANSTKDLLDNTSSSGQTVIQDLNKLLEAANESKLDIEKIIAQSDLSKYVTEPILEERLKNIPIQDTITRINGKTGDISKEDIVALGIPGQDTVYMHPEKHSPDIIDENANKQFVSESEKENWNTKQNRLSAGNNITIEDDIISAEFVKYDLVSDTNAGLMDSKDKIKLDNIDSEANKYIHPKSHSAEMIVETDARQFVSKEEKKKLNEIDLNEIATKDDLVKEPKTYSLGNLTFYLINSFVYFTGEVYFGVFENITLPSDFRPMGGDKTFDFYGPGGSAGEITISSDGFVNCKFYHEVRINGIYPATLI